MTQHNNKTIREECDQCQKALKGRYIIGKKDEDKKWMCGKMFCDMKCADEYFEEKKFKFKDVISNMIKS